MFNCTIKIAVDNWKTVCKIKYGDR